MTDQPTSQESPDEHEGGAPAAEPPVATPEPTVAAPAAEPTVAAPAAEPPVATPPPPAAPAVAAYASDAGGAGAVSERPELALGAAFAGGLVLALILKRLAR